MAGDDFAERLAGVRKRFAARLPGKLGEIDAALAGLTGDGEGVPGAVYSTHRKVHDLCGIGPTLGFIATGQAARVCERILLSPSRGQRALTEQELGELRAGLVQLRAAARFDMETVGVVPE
jgi:hypothetical protein